MTKTPLQWPSLNSDQPPRCLKCAYVLAGLDEMRCPECGRAFHPYNPTSYTLKPPFLGWKFWLPGFMLALAGCMVAAGILLSMGSWGWSLWFGVPFSGGAILGYRFRSRWWVLSILLIALMLGMIGGAAVADIAGVFCGIVLVGLFLGPVLFGGVLGALLRKALKASNFSQRGYLPVIFLAVAPVVCGLIEGEPVKHAPETVATSQTFHAPVLTCWDSIVFYEEVNHQPPLLLQIGLARPLRTVGRSESIGDIKMCLYNKGHITKRISEWQPPRLLAFQVIEQAIGYEQDVRLLGGHFEFSIINERETSVTLVTVYEPLLSPRWAWRPFERYAVHLLHEHVLEGMRRRTSEADVQRLVSGGTNAN